jgi:hypothetical protein
MLIVVFISFPTNRSLFGPHCHGRCNGGCDFLNCLVFALGDDGEATGLRVLPGRAKARRIKSPRTGILGTRLCERLTGHLAILRKCHFEFGTARRCGKEGLSIEEGRPDVAWGHRFSSEGSAPNEEYG